MGRRGRESEGRRVSGGGGGEGGRMFEDKEEPKLLYALELSSHILLVQGGSSLKNAVSGHDHEAKDRLGGDVEDRICTDFERD
eukprot:436707-Hanusia_phi.AAC.3